MRYQVLDLCRYYDVIDTQEKKVFATIGNKANAAKICVLLNKEEQENASKESNKARKEKAFSRNQVWGQAISPFVEAS